MHQFGMCHDKIKQLEDEFNKVQQWPIPVSAQADCQKNLDATKGTNDKDGLHSETSIKRNINQGRGYKY